MKEHNYALQNAVIITRPRLQIRMQNICFVISITAVILELMVKITSIFGSYRFLRIAWHDIFSLLHHLLASWNMCIPRVAGGRRANAHLLVKLLPSLQSRRILERDPWIVFRNDVVPPFWTLILPESWDESKSVFKVEVDPAPPSFHRPSPLVFFVAFQDGGHDQCTSEFSLKNACSAG